MELIVAHENTDFDAFAAAIAAQKLNPNAVFGLGRRLSRPVRSFWALHKDRFVAERCQRMDLSKVDRLIVVDVRDERRLSHVKELLERRREHPQSLSLEVYDHHPATEYDIKADHESVAQVGAVTTLFMEKLQEAAISIDPIEATLFALGIYADTAALTLSNSTARDARAVAFLLEQGASLSIVNRYLQPPLSDCQREMLGEVLRNAEVEIIGGLPIAVAKIESPTHVEGMAEVTSEACRIDRHAALFTICQVADRKTEVVARSRSEFIDVGRALRCIGGGGHAGAGSAVVRGVCPDVLKEKLFRAVRTMPPTPQVLADVMSHPVRTVAPELPLFELRGLLERWDHHGVVVVRGDKILGVISRRDVDRAAAADRHNLPVSSHMSARVVHAPSDTSLDDALSTMVSADVGRLPVVDDGSLVGIVSRSDLLGILYGKDD